MTTMHSENIHKKGGMRKCSAHNTFHLFCCVCLTDQTVFLSIEEANEKTQSTVRVSFERLISDTLESEKENEFQREDVILSTQLRQIQLNGCCCFLLAALSLTS